MPHPPFVSSNFAFAMMGQLLAAREGVSYESLLHKQITGPLGLSDTVVTLSPGQQDRFIQGYDAAHRPAPPDLEGLQGAGGIVSTAGDRLKFLVANLHPERLGGTLPEAMAMAHRPRAEGPPHTAICLAWLYTPENGTWSHGGAKRGYTSFAYFNPRGDFAAVGLLNNGPDTAGLAGLLGDHIRQRLAGEPAVSLESVFVPASRNGLRWFAAYWFTMLAAGAFIYCGMLSVQGIAAQLLPRSAFLRVSGILQMAAFCLCVCGYFLQPVFGQLTDLTAADFERTMKWLPPYWFLGLFQQLNGSPHPVLSPLAHQAWAGLAIAIGTSAVSYALSYLRTLRKIVEQPDIMPGVRRLSWLPPFGDRVQTAIGQFAIRTLARSRQHRMILAFYLGIGFAFSIFILKAPEMKPAVSGGRATDQWHAANTPLLAASVVMLALSVVGTRAVYTLPLDLRANWIFRIASVRGPEPKTVAAGRRVALLLIAVAPIWLMITAAMCLRLWPWQQAAGHLAAAGIGRHASGAECLPAAFPARFRSLARTCRENRRFT